MNGTSFLYPFLEQGERDPTQLLDELTQSALAKIEDSERLLDVSRVGNTAVLNRVAAAIHQRTDAGGSVLVIGNGGSACDTLAFVRQFDDLLPAWVSARSLAADPAVLSALSNDVGAEQMFARQIEAFGRSGDVLVAFSTSGQSANLLRALRVARQHGMLTVAFAGYHGGAMADNADVDHCVSVESDSVHRVQEAQAHLASCLCSLLADLMTATKERS